MDFPQKKANDPLGLHHHHQHHSDSQQQEEQEEHHHHHHHHYHHEHHRHHHQQQQQQQQQEKKNDPEAAEAQRHIGSDAHIEFESAGYLREGDIKEPLCEARSEEEIERRASKAVKEEEEHEGADKMQQEIEDEPKMARADGADQETKEFEQAEAIFVNNTHGQMIHTLQSTERIHPELDDINDTDSGDIADL